MTDGTSLLTSTYRAVEKSAAQATNDMTVFAVGLACSFGAGGLLQRFGWRMLNALLLPWLAVAALAIASFAFRTQRASRAVDVRETEST